MTAREPAARLLTTLPAKIGIFMSEDLLAGFLVLGSARASRAGEGALAFASFIPKFWRGRQNVHARARALPRKS
jgi:hypothetical protein